MSGGIGEEDEGLRTHGDKDEELRAAVERRRHEVVVLAEPGGAVPAKVELGEDGEEHRREDGRVDADREVAEAPAGDRRHELVEAHPEEGKRASGKESKGGRGGEGRRRTHLGQNLCAK